MREILFRGKRVYNGEWIEGSAVRFDDDKLFIMPEHNNASSMTYVEIFCVTGAIVYPFSVSQYTGLTDKNGKKIFEGDIVEALEINGKQIAPISFRKGCFFVDGNYGIFRIGVGAYKRRQLKVIGNVFDNPELLQEMKPN